MSGVPGLTRRQALGGGLVAVLAPALAGCARDGGIPRPLTTVGSSGRTVVVVVDKALKPAFAAEIAAYTRAKKKKIAWSTSTPEGVADGVKNGGPIDVVVLPQGPSLERVTNELLVPPRTLGQVGSVTYSAAAVTYIGLPFVEYLTSGEGGSGLRAHGVRM